MRQEVWLYLLCQKTSVMSGWGFVWINYFITTLNYKYLWKTLNIIITIEAKFKQLRDKAMQQTSWRVSLIAAVYVLTSQNKLEVAQSNHSCGTISLVSPHCRNLHWQKQGATDLIIKSGRFSFVWNNYYIRLILTHSKQANLKPQVEIT